MTTIIYCINNGGDGEPESRRDSRTGGRGDVTQYIYIYI